MDARTYLNGHDVEQQLAQAVSKVLQERPAKPLHRISELLSGTSDKGTAFFVVHLSVTKKDEFTTYADKAGPLIASFGGALLHKAPGEAFVGKMPGNHTMTVLVAFPSTTAAVSFYYSNAYQSIIPTRDAGMNSIFNLVRTDFDFPSPVEQGEALLVLHATPINEEKLNEYAAQAVPMLLAAGTQILGRGLAAALNGPLVSPLVMLIKWPKGKQQCLDFYETDEYKKLIPLRGESLSSDLALVLC